VKLRERFAQPLLRSALPLLVLLLVLPAPALGVSLLPLGASVLRSDEDALELRLAWKPDGFKEMEGGLYLTLDACRLEGEEGAPMLPRYRAQVALPPGRRAVLDWRLAASEAVRGEPLPFPTGTAVPVGQDEHLFVEELIREPALYDRARPIDAELDGPRWLRDQRVVELVVSPVAWDPASGLRLATEISVRIRFLPDPAGRSRTREPLRRPGRLWEPIYRATLLNGPASVGWRERVPAAAVTPREGRAEAALRLRLMENGLYGLAGDSLIAAGIPAGTLLGEIALYRQQFTYDEFEQPLFEQVAVPRFWQDRETDGLLDGDDLMVFVGRRLRHAESSPDSVEWFGQGSALWVGHAPELALDMSTQPGWEDEAGEYPVPPSFTRHWHVNGVEDYYVNITQDYYIDPPYEYWKDNLYFFEEPFGSGFIKTIDLPSPGYLPGTEAELDMLWKGRSSSSNPRYFSLELENSSGSYFLSELIVSSPYDVIYEETIPADVLVDGTSTLTIDRTDAHQWFAKFKWWDLVYSSAYEATDDSLYFHADHAAGPAELRVGGLSRGRENWLLVRSSQVSTGIEAPTRILLGAENEAGGPGDYELRFRDQLAGVETWWLVDEASLLSPGLETPPPIDVFDDTGPYDVLVIAHDDFVAGMAPWVAFREAQGYRVRMLPATQVWETFFSGCRGAIGIRNAARYAYQQWDTEVLVLVGDCNKDARAINQFAMPDFLPTHSIQESVGGTNELVALEEWVVKFQWDGWPSMMMGRLPVGSTGELEILLDKIFCYESYEDEGEGESGCYGAGDWRKRFFMIADDSWNYDEIGGCSEHSGNELNFEYGQGGFPPPNEDEPNSIGIIESSLPGDIDGVPFFISVISVPWYEEQDCATSTDIQSYLRPILAPVFIDSLSQGYTMVATQTHANRIWLGHEEYFKTGFGGLDHTAVTNWGQPFYWLVYGCHANAFAAFNEGSTSNGDCMGEKLLFVENRGAVASYASDGFEYLWPNLELGHDLLKVMFWHDGLDGFETFPEWRLGELQIVSELRHGEGGRISSFRYNLLGDPLTRMDSAPPRVHLYVDRQRMGPDDFLPPASVGDTLHIEALIVDEEYIQTLRLRDTHLGEFSFQEQPLWSPSHPDSGLIDSLLASTDTLLVDLLVPVDTLTAATQGRGRAWYLSAEVPYDFTLEELIVEGVDVAGRRGAFGIPLAKSVEFYLGAEDSLRQGQWVRGDGELHIHILVPSAEILISDFSLREDGEPRPDVNISLWAENPDTTTIVFEAVLPYDWSAGEHKVEVFYQGEGYGAITLQVDDRAHLLSGVIFPNPFRNVVTLHYELTGAVTGGSLSIYSLSGRLVHRADLHSLSEGDGHYTTWDGYDRAGDRVANGVYISRLVFTDDRGEKLVWEDKVVKMR